MQQVKQHAKLVARNENYFVHWFERQSVVVHTHVKTAEMTLLAASYHRTTQTHNRVSTTITSSRRILDVKSDTRRVYVLTGKSVSRTQSGKRLLGSQAVDIAAFQVEEGRSLGRRTLATNKPPQNQPPFEWATKTFKSIDSGVRSCGQQITIDPNGKATVSPSVKHLIETEPLCPSDSSANIRLPPILFADQPLQSSGQPFVDVAPAAVAFIKRYRV